MTLTLDRINEVLDYDEETGSLWWKARGIPEWDTRWAHKVAGTVKSGPGKLQYILVGIDGVKYRAHRIIWWMKTGQKPDHNIDHEDHNGLNNCWSNLRKAGHEENQKNLSKRIDNTTGHTGVVKFRKGFVGQIQHEKKTYRSKTYPTFDEALSWRKSKEDEFNFHENHGR